MSELNWNNIYDNLDVIVPEMKFIRANNSKYWNSPFRLNANAPEKSRKDKTVTFLNDGGIVFKEQGGDSISLFNWFKEYKSMNQKEIIETLGGNVITKGKKVITAIAPKIIPKVQDYEDGIQGKALEYLFSRGITDIGSENLLKNIGTGTVIVPNKERDNFFTIKDCLILSHNEIKLHRHELRKVLNRGKFNRFDSNNEKIKFKWFYPKTKVPESEAIELAPAPLGVLGICEGLEDACSIMQMNGYFQERQGVFSKVRESYGNHFDESFPVWCTLGIGRLSQFKAPKNIDKLYIFADRNDKEDYSYLKKMADSHREIGIEVIPMLPPKDCGDWNEYLIKKSLIDCNL